LEFRGPTYKGRRVEGKDSIGEGKVGGEKERRAGEGEGAAPPN